MQKKTQSIYQLFLFSALSKTVHRGDVCSCCCFCAKQPVWFTSTWLFLLLLFRFRFIHAKKNKKSSFSNISVLQRHSFAFSVPNLKPFWNNNISPCNSAPLTVWTSYKGPHSFLLKNQSFWVDARWCKSELEPVHCPTNMTENIYITSPKRFSLFYLSL